jgi:hypothetical protein
MTDTYDRHHGPAFCQLETPIRLTDADSEVWAGTGYSVLYAQMATFADLCTYTLHWAGNVAELVLAIVDQGYDFRRHRSLLWGHIPQFTWRYGVRASVMYDMVVDCMRRLVREGAAFLGAHVHARNRVSLLHIS